MFKDPLAGELIGRRDGSFLIAEWTQEGNLDEKPMWVAPLHFHHECDEAWYVLEGALTVRLGEEDVTVHAGGIVVAPAGVKHTYWNPSSEPVRYLLIMTPKTARLIEAIHATEDRSPAGMSALFEAHGATLIGW